MTCSVEGCERMAYKRSYCNAHYLKLRRYGDPLGGVRENDSRLPMQRICDWVWQEPGTRCLLWTRGRTKDGYAQLTVDGEQVYAHRFVYETFWGPIPEGLVVDHTCRNRHCLNVFHLQVVTRAENTRLGSVRARTQRIGQTGLELRAL